MRYNEVPGVTLRIVPKIVLAVPPVTRPTMLRKLGKLNATFVPSNNTVCPPATLKVEKLWKRLRPRAVPTALGMRTLLPVNDVRGPIEPSVVICACAGIAVNKAATKTRAIVVVIICLWEICVGEPLCWESWKCP